MLETKWKLSILITFINEDEFIYNESFESNINESSYTSAINDEQVMLKESQIKNNINYP